MPMTAAQLVDVGRPDALVAYLGQPDADAAVCDARSLGPHLAAADAATRRALVGGLVDGKIAPQTWLDCANKLEKSAPPADAAAIIDDAGRGYAAVIGARDFESSPAQQARLDVLQRFYVERKNELHGNAKVDDKLFASLRRAVFGRKLGPIATRMGTALLDAVDIEHGLWQGESIDQGTIAVLGAHADEPTLERFMLRLPEPTLRDRAKRSLVDLHIARSPFPEVHDNADAVEAALMTSGKNKLSLKDHAPKSAQIDVTKLPARAVIVRQALVEQTATLLGAAPNRGLSVLPPLSMRGALQVNVDGVSRPVTVCEPSRALDPSPCIDPKDVALGSQALYPERSRFRFVEHMPLAGAITLAKPHDLVVPVAVGGQSLASFTLALRFETPTPLVYRSLGASEKGPRLLVDVDHRDPLRYLYSVRGGDIPRIAVTEADATAGFHIVSKGGTGEAGAPGATGSSAGGSGRAPTTHTDDQGNTVVDDPGCSAGSSGSNGSSGSAGPDGPDGLPGTVQVRIVG
jgi:hypothetical protein